MKIEKLYNLIKQKNFKFTLSDETNSKIEKLQIITFIGEIISELKKKKFKNIIIFSNSSYEEIIMLIAISYFGCSVRIEDVNLSNYEIKKILKKKKQFFIFLTFL